MASYSSLKHWRNNLHGPVTAWPMGHLIWTVINAYFIYIFLKLSFTYFFTLSAFVHIASDYFHNNPLKY